jgi:hypothetical protein
MWETTDLQGHIRKLSARSWFPSSYVLPPLKPLASGRRRGENGGERIPLYESAL